MAETDEDGSFAFSKRTAVSAPFGTILIAMHPGYYPGGLDLLSPVGATSVEVHLEPGEPIEVSVVGSDGTGEGGATVHHVTCPRVGQDQGSYAPIHERFFLQAVVTDSKGHAALAPFKGEQVLWADKDEHVSIPWQGPRPSRVHLTLADSFILGGTLRFEDLEEWDPNYEGERRILVSGLTGNLWRSLARLRDVAAGDWGPVRVPLEGIQRYRIRLEGAPVVPIEEELERPPPSSHRRVDFLAERQDDLYLRVIDELERPITTAQAVVWWGPTSAPVGHNRGSASADGVIYVGTFPSGWIQYRVTASGYAPFENEVEVSGSARLEVTLRKGGRVSGHCVHAGMPVPDFSVIYWQEGNVRKYRSETFFGREDGSFMLDDLGTGGWSLYAASPTYPSGRPLTVKLDSEQTVEVELHLPTGIRGGGRIVAADTAEPIHGASLQPFSSGGMERTVPWGAPVPASSDGTFELEAFVLGSNYLRVEADGYASADIQANATDDEFLDWGEIRLHRPQTLTVSLLAAEGLHEMRPSDLRAYTAEGHILAEKHFSEDGKVAYENVPPGELRFVVAYPDNSWARMHLRLDPGREWSFDLKVAGDRRLDIHVLDSQGKPLPFIPMVMVTAQEDAGVFVVRLGALGADEQISFAGIRSDKAQVWVLAQDGSTLATRDISFGAGPSLPVEIRVGEKPFRVRVVDADGEPLSGAWVTIRSVAGAEIHGVKDTGADGWASLFGLPQGRVLMDVRHGIAGMRMGVPIDATVEEMEFVLEATGWLELEVRDGKESLPGVAVQMETTGGVSLGSLKQTDPQGLVRFEPLGEGSYRMACRRSDCWAASSEIALKVDERLRREVQIRRLGNLELTAINAQGLPVSGLPIGLTSSEFATSVQAWIEGERVRSRTGLTTDMLGKLSVEGLPHGSYTWSAAVDGQALSGSFELTAAPSSPILIRLP